MDTMKAVSPETLRTVGLISAVFGYYRADADVKSAGEVLDVVRAAAHQRFGWEKDNSRATSSGRSSTPTALRPPSTRRWTRPSRARATAARARSVRRRSSASGALGIRRRSARCAPSWVLPGYDTHAYDKHAAATAAAVAADAAAAQANAAHLFAVSHFFDTSIAVNGGAEWTNSRAVTLTLHAGSYAAGGVTGMRFSDNGKSWPASFQPYATDVAYTLPAGDGAKKVYAQFQDSEGNISDAVSAAIKLDTHGPRTGYTSLRVY